MASETAEALKAEATNTKVKVEFRGKEFLVEKDMDEWSLDVLEAYEEGNMVLTLRGLLGPSQWLTIKSFDLKLKDLKELAETFLGAIGLSSEKSDS